MKEEWDYITFEKAITFSQIGLVKSKKEQSPNNQYRYIKMDNILNENGFDASKLTYVNATSYEVDKFRLENEDFLFNTRNSYELVGKSCLYSCNSEPTLFNNNILRARFIKSLIPKFVAYAFSTNEIKENLEKMKSGTTSVVGIYYKSLKNLIIPLPPLLEQKHIVAVLDKTLAVINKAKANTEQNLKNAKELFDSYLQGVLENKGENWQETTLGEVCHKVEYGTSSKSKPEGELPVLRMGNIQNGKFTWEKLVYSDNEKDNNQYLLKYNDVLFNRTNSPELVGKAAIYKGEMPAIFAGYLIRIHRKENLLDADYLNYYLNSQGVLDYGKTVMTSSVNQANINGTKLKAYPIPIPPLEEQKSIVKKLDALSSKIKKLENIYQKKLDNLEELKKSILQKAFSGELNTEKELEL